MARCLTLSMEERYERGNGGEEVSDEGTVLSVFRDPAEATHVLETPDTKPFRVIG